MNEYWVVMINLKQGIKAISRQYGHNNHYLWPQADNCYREPL